MTERRCATCTHWADPATRTDYFGVLVDIDDDPDVPLDVRRAAADAADMRLGSCDGVPHHPNVSGLPIPAAVVMDASAYQAQLFTSAEFFCALWTDVPQPIVEPPVEDVPGSTFNYVITEIWGPQA